MSEKQNSASGLDEVVEDSRDAMKKSAEKTDRQMKVEQVGTVTYMSQGIAVVKGLPDVGSGEVIQFPNDVSGLAFDLDPDSMGVVLLDDPEGLSSGDEVKGTGRVLDVPVGEEVIGRGVDALGRPLDGKDEIQSDERRPVEREAPEIMDRAPVNVPLQTGIKAVDALIPVGRGQRELIVGDRQTGKTAIAIDTIINQADKDVVCFYCAIGKQTSAVAKAIADLRGNGAMDYTAVISATGEDQPGLQWVAAYSAMTMAEYFMEKGKDALVVLDDLTRHAWAYRQISLLLRRPPGREAYPGDVFYIHSRMLERSTHLRDDLGGGSLTALPVVETEAQNISAYIPTNLISITDGQIYVSPDLFQKGIMPAIDIGESVSRVGGKTQLPAYRSVAGDLRLSYSQFEELESFARFGTRLDEESKKKLARGRRVREILKQPQYSPLSVPRQIAPLLAVTEGVMDDLPVERIGEAAGKLMDRVERELSEVASRIESGEELSDDDEKAIVELAKKVVTSMYEKQDEEEGGKKERGKKDEDKNTENDE